MSTRRDNHSSLGMRKFAGRAAGVASLAIGLAVAAGALAAEVAVISEGGTASVWRFAPGVPKVLPGYPDSVADKTEDVCVGLGYLLNPDGSTSDIAVLNSWGSRTPEDKVPEGHFDPYARYAAAALMQWRFVPVGGGHANIKPIYTAATFTFSTNAEADRENLRARCVIEDLSGFVTKARADAYKKGNIKKSEMARDRTQNAVTFPTRGQ